MGSLSLCQISLCQEFSIFGKFINCCRKNKDNNSEEDFKLKNFNNPPETDIILPFFKIFKYI